MRIVLSIIFVLFFTSLTPQQKKHEEQSTQPLAVERVVIDYDSLAKEAIESVEKIQREKENIAYYRKVTAKENAKFKKSLKELKNKPVKVDTIYIKDTICLMCKENIDSIE